ncbi:MAG: dual specificity protein phosphatase [Anaerolineales bacterium]|jgi:dual specificity MAP kinase phosphatase|nr:dual specificity protein phosphatase [Anaerolineales bacterium]
MNFSQITPDLFIGPMPTAADYIRLRDLGVRLVLNMRFASKLPAGLSHAPIEVLWLRTFDSPLTPMPLKTIITGTRRALEVIRAGGKIYSHCAKGRHRSVVMGAAILIAQGHAPETAIHLIKEKRPISDPNAFYIRKRIFDFAHYLQEYGLPA